MPAHSWTGVVGPNGGGKSTLLKAMAGLLNHKGRITLHWPLKHPGRIGYMPQRAELDASLPITVQDYLRMHCERRPVWWRPKRNERIDELIAELEVAAFLKQRMGSLSMGQHQRLMLCAALANEPQLLLLDEPMAGVDEAGREVLLRVLKRYHDRGGSIVMVEHHWDVLRAHCSAIVWIDQGLIAAGPSSEVLERLRQNASPFEIVADAAGQPEGSDEGDSSDAQSQAPGEC